MRTYKLTTEHILYLMALLLAVVTRLVGLGHEALSNPEAVFGLQALALIRGTASAVGPHPAYLVATALLDYFGGANNWTARLLPALAGVALIIVPYLLRARIGRWSGVLLAFMLAVDPGLVAVSRQAGSVMIAIAFTLLALACLVEGKAVWAGVFAGVALLSGPSIWPNLACIAVASWIAYRKEILPVQWVSWRALLGAAGVTLLAFGTFFLIFPASLSAAAASLPVYLQSWTQPGTATVLGLLGAILAYEMLGLVWGLAGVVRGLLEGNRLDRFLIVWWVLALLIAVLNPARQVVDLAWSMIPLLALAARGLERLLDLEEDRWPVLGQAGLVLMLLLLIGNLIVSWPNGDSSSTGQTYKVLVLVVAVLLIVGESIMVAWGWSRRVGLYGLAWGVAGFLFLISVSTAVNSAGLSGRPLAEAWRVGAPFPSADLISAAVHNYTIWRKDASLTPEIVILNLDAPAVEWLLRNYPNVRVEKSIPATATPDMLITADQAAIDLAAAYTGEGFELARSPGWDLIAPGEWVNWLVYRAVKPEVWAKETIVLWVRSDLFPGTAERVVNP